MDWSRLAEQMSGPWHDHEPRARNRAMHFLGFGERNHRVFRTGHDGRWTRDVRQKRPRVGTIAQRRNGRSQSRGRVHFDEAGHDIRQVGLLT